jgi:hypothetical protein
MVPWEREIYVSQVAEWVKEENKRKQEENAKMNRKR